MSASRLARIAFNIPGAGVRTIASTSAQPSVSAPVIQESMAEATKDTVEGNTIDGSFTGTFPAK